MAVLARLLFNLDYFPEFNFFHNYKYLLLYKKIHVHYKLYYWNWNLVFFSQKISANKQYSANNKISP